LPPHGVLAGAGVVGRESDGFLARNIFPKALRGSTFVALRITALERKPSEEERVATCVIAALRRLAERNGVNTVAAINGEQFGIRKGRVACARKNDFAVRSPAIHAGFSVKGTPCWNAARYRHGVDLGRAFVIRTERERLTVRRKGGKLFLSQTAGQARGKAALSANLPKIALCGEHDFVSIERGKTVIALVLTLLRKGKMGKERDGGTDTKTAHAATRIAQGIEERSQKT